MTTALLNYGSGYQPRSNLTGNDRILNTEYTGTLADIAQGDVALFPVVIANVSAVRAFWFNSQAPLSYKAVSLYGDTATVTDTAAATHTIAPPYEFPEGTDPIELAATVAAWTMFSAASGGGIYGDILGTTTTNGLPVAGRAIWNGVTDHSLVDDMAAALDVLIKFQGQSSSGANAGAIWRGDQGDPIPILIPEADYTAAIVAAGNTHTDGAGTWEIVGLYETEGRA
jgi:hypothetical protein